MGRTTSRTRTTGTASRSRCSLAAGSGAASRGWTPNSCGTCDSPRSGMGRVAVARTTSDALPRVEYYVITVIWARLAHRPCAPTGELLIMQSLPPVRALVSARTRRECLACTPALRVTLTETAGHTEVA